MSRDGCLWRLILYITMSYYPITYKARSDLDLDLWMLIYKLDASDHLDKCIHVSILNPVRTLGLGSEV